MLVEIGLLYGGNQGPINERMGMVRDLLLLEGDVGSYWERWQYLNSRVVIEVELPNRRANMHHGFDSKLNKSWPNGAGAGWVIEK